MAGGGAGKCGLMLDVDSFDSVTCSWQEMSSGTLMHEKTSTRITPDRGIEVRGEPMKLAVSDLQIENECLGSGASGEVFLGFFRSTNELVAVKRQRKDEKAERDMLFHEIRTLIDAGQAPGLVQWHGAFHDVRTSRVYLVLEYMDWGCLSKLQRRLPANCGVPSNHLACLTRQALEGLHYLHFRGKLRLVHGDIKPANILLNRHGFAKLTDFGLTRAVDMSSITAITGTQVYLAPEKVSMDDAQGKQGVTPDIWSFGMVVHELADGCHPFAGSTSFADLFAKLCDNPEPRLGCHHPAELCQFAAACLIRQIDHRATAADLLQYAYVSPHVGTKDAMNALGDWLCGLPEPSHP